ncbi:similar to Saccharomyces cerevisiae YPL071C Putative protein of unknown function [Maudiozyma barnettii]|uniref:Uncharacterized protein n=1 Tax=Maudiozyma barnettii TaxID=61262 RepID=A0A8H2VI34_9SACH|nr:hypothetical protein [Kazachstania barnettii]CAB4255810.1 similar to Saccharomyces cerevisiae YPL071C Putative protein of unknown function [Kazachstania barnettii]CAD1784371.1 similar to Saccharomyces cerevisiae YPL071C Putative protein of unknown function [Kazachstania barnettii]
MGYFKLKRQHAPDSIGVENYKRRRLLQDFASLSISSSQNASNSNKTGTPNVTKILSGDILVPDTVKNKLLKFSQSEKSTRSSAEAIYDRILEWIKEDASQIIKWVDWEHELFVMWYTWYHNLWYNNNNNNIDMEVDPQQQQAANSFQVVNNDINESIDVDMDVDMDA